MGVGATQLQSGENKIFHYLGEKGNELKLTNFQKKSSCPKSSILASRPAVQEVGASDCSHTRSLQDHFRGTCQHQTTHPTKESLSLNTLSDPLLKKLSNKEGQHPLSHSPAYQPYEGTEALRKPIKSVSAWIGNQKKEP
jgi:hypothetical protein